MASVLEQVFILFVFALAGFILAKAKLVDNNHVGILSKLEFYIFLPCVTFQTFAQRFTVAYLQEKYFLVLISIGILLVLELLARLIAPRLSKDSYQRLVYRYSIMIPNFGYFGYALMQGLFGAEGLMDMMMFTLPMTIYTTTAGYMMLTNQPGKLSAKKLLTPSIITMLLGCIVGITGLALPAVVDQVVEKSAACMAPISMLLAGMVIAQYNLKELLCDKRAYLISALRLLIIPALIFAVMKLAGLELGILTAIVTYCCPCGLNPIVYGKLAGQDCRSAASMTLISTVLALVTIPLCVHFFIG